MYPYKWFFPQQLSQSWLLLMSWNFTYMKKISTQISLRELRRLIWIDTLFFFFADTLNPFFTEQGLNIVLQLNLC